MSRPMKSGPVWTAAAMVIALGLLLAVLLAAPAFAQEAGTLRGTVSNGSSGGAPIGEGITLTLHVYQDDVEVETRPGTTEAIGQFSFDGLSTAAGRAYRVEAFYLGIGYFAPVDSVLTFSSGETALTGDVTVYETTGDAAQITIDSGHLIAESLGPMLRVSELYLFGNTGDRTYVGTLGADGQLSTVHVPLPPGAVGVAFGEDDAPDRYIVGEDGVRDTTPVRPGQETALVFFSYHVPVEEQSLRFERSYDYPVGLLNVLLAQPGLALSGDRLQARGPQSFQGRQYEQYAAVNLPAGSVLAFDLAVTASEAAGGTETGPAAGQPVSDQQGLIGTIGLILAGLAASGALGYGLAARPQPAGGAGAVPEANPEARRLLAQVAALDDAFEAGEIDEETYRGERAAIVEAIGRL